MFFYESVYRKGDKMILVISGLHGTGKSTIAKKIAESLKFEYHSTGTLFRNLAEKNNMSLKDFSEYAVDHPEIDLELDTMVKNMASSGKDIIFDGQIGAYILGDLANYCILLKCAKDVRIARMKNRDNVSMEDMIDETLKREKYERQRFIDIYGIDVLDGGLILANYDLILDVTNLNIEQVFEICLTAVKASIKNKE